MIFTHPRVISYILSQDVNGYIATMRTHRYREGTVVKIYIDSKTIYAEVVKTYINNETNRDKLSCFSGFSSADEWLGEAMKIFGRKPRYIVLLRIFRIEEAVKR